MEIKKIRVEKPNFAYLDSIIIEMKLYLRGKASSLSLDSILDLQDENGSFSLFETYKIPREAIVDFIYLPSYIGSSILMKEYMYGNYKLEKKLEKSLNFVVDTKLKGHGYESNSFLVESMKIFYI